MFGHVQHHAQTQHTLKQLNYIGRCTHIFVLHFHDEDLALEGHFVDSWPKSENETNVTQKTSNYTDTHPITTRMHVMSTANPQTFPAAMQRVFTFLQNSLSSIQFKTVFKQLEKPCISPCLSEVSPVLPLNQFQCLSE